MMKLMVVKWNRHTFTSRIIGHADLGSEAEDGEEAENEEEEEETEQDAEEEDEENKLDDKYRESSGFSTPPISDAEELPAQPPPLKRVRRESGRSSARVSRSRGKNKIRLPVEVDGIASNFGVIGTIPSGVNPGSGCVEGRKQGTRLPGRESMVSLLSLQQTFRTAHALRRFDRPPGLGKKRVNNHKQWFRPAGDQQPVGRWYGYQSWWEYAYVAQG
ncbi:hypothetical protein FN846DRAFT_886173 [Sphaerosporella brunnea]|uniref:Uncharacterized protein n=1 Tax=Sphaerosporella brunnea TaxID=1250544 RepID=A0A5J5F9R9_9PEZI|nr:hypothetical protein FN846DRAFT_886173 [Sphaerosporella brunnea]